MWIARKSVVAQAAWVAAVCLTAICAIVMGGLKQGSWEAVDYGGMILAAVPVALTQGFFARRTQLLPLILAGWVLAACVVLALASSHVDEDYYCWAVGAWDRHACLQHIRHRMAVFSAGTLPAIAFCLASIGLVCGRRSNSNPRADASSIALIWITGLLPLLLFVNFHPPGCDMVGRFMYYDPILCEMTVTAITAGFVQGACLRRSFHTPVVAVGWMCVASSLAWFAFNFDHRFPVTDAFYRRGEFYISLHWSSLIYMLSAIPLAGSLCAYWGRRWDDADMRWEHLVPPVLLIITVVTAFVYLWHL